ncbi:hypothetical protein ALP99_102478 [Pseudomonas syringae pv. tomato]|uniref:Uncharacterized protein n=4 Tax=Pseudomonas syringae group TaxID=136849 RepID=A0A0P9HW27_9PSED|nr:Unknown protein sequence [Pseudomonas syringae pv. maculicola]KPB82001.1 Unknown protein sequence [Pseudomonas syringae pv. maculicola str. M6]KPW27792.1 hypothetical protein ALO87_102385 [Pseudomonas syringae pv. apii]KPW44659.1 hypothetical protein ALO88_102572 [Pseudomonas syringae pv. antirrhini]RMO91167.1 hypothetical protein ALQ32_102144 [Pseudomonas syringae pv. tagetis]RMQ72700.1 hypothetical protein ALQ00_102368 [Pseudomonas syringae pv. tomato]RMT28936.1 hypothetical protein ALP5
MPTTNWLFVRIPASNAVYVSLSVLSTQLSIPKNTLVKTTM